MSLLRDRPWWLISLLLLVVFLLPGREWVVSALAAHTEVWHGFLRYFGIDHSSGPWYAFWSGFGADLGELTLVGAVVGSYRHHRCHVPRCWRLGHPDPSHGFPACRAHHSLGHRVGRRA